MSMELMVKAMKTKVGSPLRKLVLLKLADNANDQGECWPSYQYIADQCEISRRSVMSHLDELIKVGLITKTIRKGQKGNSSNVYLLNFYKLIPVTNDKGVITTYHLPSAGDSPSSPTLKPSSEGGSPPSATLSPPSAGDSLGGSAGDSPRTYHSLESVNEPVNESKDTCSPSANERLTNQNYLKSRFDEFYGGYGKKVNRAGAVKAFSKINLPTQDRELFVSSIIDSARRWGDLYRIAPSDQKAFQPHPASWISGKRWEDEALPTLRQALMAGSAPMIGSPRDQVNDSLTDIHNTDW